MKEVLMPPDKPKRYPGEYVGIVEDTVDPDGFMRVQVRVIEVFTDDVPVEDLPWATYKLPVGTRPNDGYFTPAQVGDYVWVDFPFKGDTRRPRITGSVHYCPDETPNFPSESLGSGPGGGGIVGKILELLSHFRLGNEPEPAEPEYHTNSVWTQHGTTIETNEDGSYRITQREAGTAIEISTEGHLIIHGEGNVYISSKKNQEVFINGDTEVRQIGDAREETMGKRKISARQLTLESGEDIKIRAPRIDLN
jgi:Type VI secretion system/phage-baseplate injector OB domain